MIRYSRARGSDQDLLKAYEEASEPRVRIGQVEVITSKVYGHHLSWLTFTEYTNDNGYVPLVLIPSQSFFVARVTRWMPLVDQELLSLLRHLSYPLAFSRIRVAQSLVFFCYRCLPFYTFVFGHCVVCPSIYGFLLLL